ncbi:hypothetical protein BS47DRAFT_1422381 [Hydnum rufescens UP504]|uniref:Uncharacterized protein n=1 Tax=Hydnum rufescens UP504 TaxID=1448309 RepID=A0A9P6DQD0_9AGAM|nr:hypothetical protein BS47DRAFT_1422381 [Hydnum rufescens UP504]
MPANADIKTEESDFNQARIDVWNSPDYNLPIYEPAICEATGANIDETSNAIGMDSHVGPKFLGAKLTTHTNPPPAPARTDDDDTGKEEAPHTCCGGGVTLDRQTRTNPALAPARTDDDDYWGEIRKRMQPRKTPMIDYLPLIKRGLKYGATHPLRRALSPSLKPCPNQSRDNAYSKIWNTAPTHPLQRVCGDISTHLPRRVCGNSCVLLDP